MLSRYVAQNGGSRIEWLGPSPGIRWIMDLINSEYPLSVITYTVPIADTDQSLYEILKNSNTLLEVKNYIIEDGSLPCILYSSLSVDDNFPPNVHPVTPRTEGIYEVKMKNSFLTDEADEANRNHIIRVKKFIRVIGERIEVTVFLPSIQRQEYYSILYSAARKENNRLTVKYMFDYVPDAWEFL